MKFTFSPQFQCSIYQQMLCRLGELVDTYRMIGGINYSAMKADLHVGFRVLKK